MLYAIIGGATIAGALATYAAYRISKRAYVAAMVAVVCYYTIGITMGAFLAARLPAMNVLGVLWYATLWPWFILRGKFGDSIPGPPVPEWCFTF